MADAAMAGELEHVEMAGEVGRDIGARIVDRIADPGLRAEMDDAVELGAAERRVERLVIREIDLREAECAAVQPSRARRADPASAADRNRR